MILYWFHMVIVCSLIPLGCPVRWLLWQKYNQLFISFSRQVKATNRTLTLLQKRRLCHEPSLQTLFQIHRRRTDCWAPTWLSTFPFPTYQVILFLCTCLRWEQIESWKVNEPEPSSCKPSWVFPKLRRTKQVMRWSYSTGWLNPMTRFSSASNLDVNNSHRTTTRDTSASAKHVCNAFRLVR